MLQLYTKLGPDIYSTEDLHTFSHQSLFVVTCRLPAPTKVFLQLEYNTELLLHL